MSTDDDLRSFGKALASPILHPYLSVQKVFHSEQFSRLIQSYDHHFDQHRDAGMFERIMTMLGESKYREIFAEYLQRRHGLRVSREGKRFQISVLKENSSEAQKNKNLNFAQFIGNPESSLIAKFPEVRASGKSPSKNGYVDALDHPARLQGSFGHGRRK